MDEKSGGGQEADARMGMIQVNDLVYKLETDLSVAINRTHKTQYFQNQSYTNAQTTLAIVNSGADYIDPRRSFFSFDFIAPQTLLAAFQGNADYANAFISFYFGKNGSVLNLIDSVVVSSRSGDELSRVNDFGVLNAIMIPEIFGVEWRDSIGQEMGIGSFVGGFNDSTYVNPALPVNSSPLSKASEQQRRRFVVPLYLLSPIFNYGRLLPSMLMSGLRIEIKWKTLDVACQQFWEGFPLEYPVSGAYGQNLNFSDNDVTAFKTYLGASALAGNGALDDSVFPANAVTYAWTQGAIGPPPTSGTLVLAGLQGLATGFLHTTGGIRDFVPGDVIAISDDTTPGTTLERSALYFTIVKVVNATTAQCISTAASFPARTPVGQADATWAGGGLIGGWRLSYRRSLSYQRDFGAPAFHSKFLTPTTPLTSYNIQNPELQLCSIQLTDAIQRTLNEFSAVNGLEIVYADYDRTSTPLAGAVVPIYTEVRKSASRALAAFARVVQNTSDTHRYDSTASVPGVYWNNYQWQLGSLYFPQQRVESQNPDPNLQHDALLAMAYAYTQDAFDRYHPRAAPTMATLRGVGIDFNKLNLHPTEVHAEHGPSLYLAPYSAYGKWGSFVNGATTIAVTLERSSLFDLSGIPINNSRVLALRGEVDMSAYQAQPTFRALLYVFLKYVRLARIFLVNCEVEQ